MKLIVGLGNPGKEYERTRHNVGFEVLDELARRGSAEFRKTWFVSARAAKVNVNGEDVLLVKAQTFMNRSGQAVRPLLKRRGLEAADLVVVLDDVELERGRLRVRKKGSAGGHKGLESVIRELGTDEFARVRVGIGPRPAGEELVGYVLGRFSKAERPEIEAAVKKAADAVECAVRDGADRAMNDFN
jgi:peptidyl-tRNA hydrolase, PTH1 family